MAVHVDVLLQNVLWMGNLLSFQVQEDGRTFFAWNQGTLVLRKQGIPFFVPLDSKLEPFCEIRAALKFQKLYSGQIKRIAKKQQLFLII